MENDVQRKLNTATGQFQPLNLYNNQANVDELIFCAASIVEA